MRPPESGFSLFTPPVWFSLCDFLCRRAPQIPFLNWPEAVLLSASHRFKPSLLHCASPGNPIFPVLRSLSSCLNCFASIFISNGIPFFPREQTNFTSAKASSQAAAVWWINADLILKAKAALPTHFQGNTKGSGFWTGGWLRGTPALASTVD